MRTLMWMFVVCTVLAAIALHGLDISSTDSPGQEAPANFEIQPGSAGNGDNGGMEPSRYTR